ncbi:MAG: glucose-phosphate thymidylyltransferase [Solirubrobacteraceae bacterium]|jgi:glucose-1-phosphate thymidylyltransferase|nr:glucose-phosphate thymidylyltransferase [Solirubrobacteraceae bacterium]
MPPALIPIGNRPLLFHIIEMLSTAGITDVGLVVSATSGEYIRGAVGNGSAWGMRATYIEQPEPCGAVEALLAAESFLGSEPCLLHASDCLVPDGLPDLVQKFVGTGLDALMVVTQRTGGSDDDAEADADRTGSAEQAAPTPLLEPLGVHLVSERVVNAAHWIEPSWRGRLEIDDALERVRSAGGRVAAQQPRRAWRYRGRPDDLLDVNRAVLDELERDHKRATIEDSSIRGKVVVDPSATIESSVVRGPAIVGPGARISDAYIGPYTSVGARTRISDSEVEDSILLPGAVVEHLKVRLAASVIGPDVRLFHDFAPPNVMRLRLAAGDEVALA